MGTGLILLYVKGINDRATQGQELVEVLVATDTIDAGETMSAAQAAGKVELKKIVKDSVVDGALSSTKSIEDDVALGTIYPGEQIIAKKFGAPGAQEVLPIPDDLMAISVELTDPERVAGFVNPGSYVAIFMSLDPKLIRADGSALDLAQYTSMIVPKVQVIGVGATTSQTRTTKSKEGGSTTEEVPKTILTLAVNQDQAEKIIFADRNTDLTFALLTEESKAVIRPGIRMPDVDPNVFKGVLAQ